jgi:hypothetical protein
LAADGLNVPQHFLIEVRLGQERTIVDPFFCGQVLSPGDVVARLPFASQTGQPISECLSFPIASHQQWLTRMIANLQHIFATTGRWSDLAAMCELQQLAQSGSGHSRDGS